MATKKNITVAKIRMDGGTQPRRNIDDDFVAARVSDLEAGDKFPPVIVFNDGTDYWLADGFHRVLAHRTAEKRMVPAEVHKGTQRDAVLYSCGANADQNSLPRTSKDKRRAVMVMLRDDLWSKWSDRKIAKACAVTHPMVATLRSGKNFQNRRKVSNLHGVSDAIMRVIEALETLATVEQTPGEYVEELPDYVEDVFGAALPGAVAWLADLEIKWNSSQQGREG